MWHWDQGHLAYYQFDALKKVASFAVSNDLRTADRETLEAATGLPFRAPATHSPWRQYSRVFKLCLLVSESNERAAATPVAELLATPGAVTSDEYLHFLVSAFTEPAPALQDWRHDQNFRYPLLFSLRYLLAKCATANGETTTTDEMIGAFSASGFVGDETDTEFSGLFRNLDSFEAVGRNAPDNLRRQARESLLVIAQISYLYYGRDGFRVSLHPDDARDMFIDLEPVIGPRADNREDEIRRLANLFRDGSTSILFDYPATVIDAVEESGFQEGTKVKRTHVTIERNASLRSEFFAANPGAVCDICLLDTRRSYPWTSRVLDLHHLLPLSSGTRIVDEGTTFADIVAICPTCHRAVHRFYDDWLRDRARPDFVDRDEARLVYDRLKQQYPGPIHA